MFLKTKSQFMQSIRRISLYEKCVRWAR